MRRIVVVGAAIAGVNAVEALRDQGFDGEVTLVGAESALPYDRPPLSKAALSGIVPEADLLLRPSAWYAERDIELRLGRPAVGLAVRDRSVQLADGTALRYDGVVLATGSVARVPAGIAGDVDRIHLLRTRSDNARLRDRLTPGARLVVIGAGFIGLEVAASARSLGVEVTVVEIGPAPLAAVLGVEVGEWFGRLHARHGVVIRCRESVRSVHSHGDQLRVQLAGGDVLPADAVVAGVGAAPATEWLISSGVDLRDGGVVCDAGLRASAPGVVAAGDIACWHNGMFGESMRVEHWTTAVEQGRHAALTLLGAEPGPYVGPPYFWTDQFTAGTRTVGRTAGADQISIRRADDDALIALFGRADRFRAALCVNAPRALLTSRKALVAGASWSEALTAVPGLT